MLVIYVGDNAESMRKTVQKLRLPRSWPTNLGEKVFYLFRKLLKNASGHIYLEQAVAPGKEHQFKIVLQRLIDVYESDVRYAALK